MAYLLCLLALHPFGEALSRRGEGSEEWLGGPLWSPAAGDASVLPRCELGEQDAGDYRIR